MNGLPDGVTKGVFVTLIALFCACAVLAFTSCGMVISDPEDVNGAGDVSIVYEVSGTVSSAGIIVRGNDTTLLAGTEAEDGTVTPEEVSLPWTSETYSYTGEKNVFFSISAKNTERQEKTSGTLTTYSEDHLVDGSANFTSDVSAGDYVYNEGDDIFALITAVNSSTDCSLSRVLFAESWRTYYIYQKGTTITSGTTTGTAADKLIDINTNFIGKVILGDRVANNSEPGSDTATVDNDPVGDGTVLDIDDDIFTDTGQHYLISRDDPPEGTADGEESYQLINSGGGFIAAGVVPGHVAVRLQGQQIEALAQVLSVSDTTLTLDKDIFGLGDSYRIYTVKSDAAYSTTQAASMLINSSALFFSGVKKGDVVYNPALDVYGKIDSVASNTELTLDADVFPAVDIPYAVYAPRTLTVTVYVNGEAYDSFTSEHWDTVEAALTRVLTTAELNMLAE